MVVSIHFPKKSQPLNGLPSVATAVLALSRHRQALNCRLLSLKTQNMEPA